MTDLVYERKCDGYSEDDRGCGEPVIPGSRYCYYCDRYERKIADWIRDSINRFASRGYARMASAAGWSDAEMYGVLKGYTHTLYGLCDYANKARLVAINANVAALDYGDEHPVKIIRRDSLRRVEPKPMPPRNDRPSWLDN